jgi:hypothetical protein
MRRVLHLGSTLEDAPFARVAETAFFGGAVVGADHLHGEGHNAAVACREGRKRNR